MNLPKTSFLHRDIIKQHKVFTAIVVLQCLVILWLLVGLFRPAFSLTILPQDFSAAVEEKSDSQYQAQMTEESLQFQIAEEAKRVPESEGEANFEQLESQGHAIRSGAYEVTIQYQTDSTSANIQAAEVSFEEVRFTNLVYGDAITLTGARNSLTGRLWIPIGANASDVVVRVKPLGECDFQIESIVLQEQFVYRVMRILAIIVLFVGMDIVGACFFSDNMTSTSVKAFSQKAKSFCCLLIIIVVAGLPFLYDQLLIGDDMVFHLTRIVSLAKELENGQFPVRIYSDMLNGYGYATPLYYCDFFLYLPAILYNCFLPLQLCYQIYGMLVTAATCAICYYSLYGIFQEESVALVGTAVYTMSAYRISNVYWRASLGEYTAMAFIPLVGFGVYRIYEKQTNTWRNSTPLAIGMTGILLSHLLSFELVCMALIVFAVLNAKKTFQKTCIAAIIRSAALSIGLSFWFLVPFLYSIATQNIKVTDSYVRDFQQQGTTLWELLSVFPMLGQIGPRGTLGPGVVASLLVAVSIALYRHFWKKQNPLYWRILKQTLVAGGITMVAALKWFPWNALMSTFENTIIHKVLGILQFPWRYLSLTTVFLSFAVVAALSILKKSRVQLFQTCSVLIVGVTILYAGSFFTQIVSYKASSVKYDICTSNLDRIMGGEYLLSEDVNTNYLRPICPDENLLIKWYDKTDGVAHITLDNTGDTEATVVLPIFDYGNYHAVDTEGTEWTLGTSENSLLQLTVPAGYSGSFSIQYKEPIWWRAAELVSLATFAGLVGIWLKDKKKNRQLHKLPGDLAG